MESNAVVASFQPHQTTGGSSASVRQAGEAAAGLRAGDQQRAGQTAPTRWGARFPCPAQPPQRGATERSGLPAQAPAGGPDVVTPRNQHIPAAPPYGEATSAQRSQPSRVAASRGGSRSLLGPLLSGH